MTAPDLGDGEELEGLEIPMERNARAISEPFISQVRSGVTHVGRAFRSGLRLALMA